MLMSGKAKEDGRKSLILPFSFKDRMEFNG